MLSGNYLNFGDSDGTTILFYILFFFCYNLVMILFFVAIILSNYLELRNKLELTTTALARLSANKSQAITQKWINLICMKPPIDEADLEEKKDKEEKKPSHSERCINLN